ncbi:hypothetical protein LCGC14_2573020, partial [marine sediment metagenome]
MRAKSFEKSKPIRAKRVELKEKMAPLEKVDQDLRDAIIKAERPVLPEIDQERAMIQKALRAVSVMILVLKRRMPRQYRLI